MSSTFLTITDLGSNIQALIQYKVGLFSRPMDRLINRLLQMYVIYFNSILQIAINKRVNKSLEYRGILASFLLGILLLFPRIRVAFTYYLQSRNGINLP